MRHYLAVDLGAESGRVILGAISDGKLQIEELHRFPNEPVRLPSGLYWDTFRLYHEILVGLAKAGRERKLNIEGIGIDTWGVDFGLFAAGGSLVHNPRHYRDAANIGMTDKLCAVVPREEVFEHTGLQFMDLNSLPQLYSLKDSPALGVASRLLFMPDIFNYWLTGVQKAELTIASTSQFYNPRERRWATELLEKLGLPTSILPEIVPPGQKLGTLLPDVAEAAGLDASTPVFTTCCHDTASAVAAVPAEGSGWCYISSGTWSLMGAELDEPVVTAQALEATLTNEVGAEGKIRFLKNIAGLWPLQECRRAWAAAGKQFSYADLARRAAEAKPFAAVISPDSFLEPGRMPERIADYCRNTGQAPPANEGEVARTIFEGLALRYRQVLEYLEETLMRRIDVIHIVGGGARNELLNQLTADATGRRVLAGPDEATAAGNLLMQAIGAGLLENLAAARRVVKDSFPLRTYAPAGSSGWDEAYAKFRQL